MTDGGIAAVKQRVRVDQLRLFLAHWRGSLIAITLGTLALTIAARDMVPLPLALGWCAMACGNYGAQAWVSWHMERADALDLAMRRGLPMLMVSVAVSSIVWGLMPWLVWGGPTAVVLVAALFNMILVFAVVNSPSTPGLCACAVLPTMSLTTAALLTHENLRWLGLGCAGLSALILLYGVRVQTAIGVTMTERNNARDLAEALRQQQQRLLELEAERTLLLERQRLMRDLHDGLGSTLTSSLLAVEQGAASPPELAAMLRDCVDDLRAVIDSLEPIDHDLIALLAGLRFRVGPRLERAGIQLEWEVHDLPPLPWLGPTEALQVTRLLQEVLTNAAKHSQARRVCVSTRATADAATVCVADDGCGFAVRAPSSGRGLGFMAQRAALLAGRLRIESLPAQGTTVWLELPFKRADPGSSASP